MSTQAGHPISRSSEPQTKRRFARDRWPLVAGVILAIWLSYALYARDIALPYLQEDVTHIRWLQGRGLLEIFLSAEGAPAYRPLGKFLIKSWYLLFGGHDRIWLHYQNNLIHSLSIALAAALGSWLDRSKRRYLTGGLAAVLFALYPFSYQAIVWINNFFYPLINLLLLLSAACYWQAKVRHSRLLMAAAVFFSILAPFAIEYGAMSFALIFSLEIVLWLQKRQSRIQFAGPAVILLGNLVFVAVWATIPEQSYSFGLPTPERILQIASYFLQGLSFPLAPLQTWLFTHTPLTDLQAVWVVALPLLAALAYTLWRAGQRTILVGALCWFVLLNLPALVFVDFDYVINSPRLLYPASIAVAWFWAPVAALPFAGARRQSTRLARSGLLLLCILLWSTSFLISRLQHYRLAQQPVLQLAEAAAATPEERLVVVNFPSWITPGARYYPLGNHGVQVIPGYVPLSAAVFANAGVERDVVALPFGNVRTPQLYYYGMYGQTVDYEGIQAAIVAGGPVFLTSYTADSITLQEVGEIAPVRQGQPVATFGNLLALERADVVPVSPPTGDEPPLLVLGLQWRLLAPVNSDFVVFAHAYGADGTLLAQADGYPLGGLAPFWLWDPGDGLRDRRNFVFDKQTLGDVAQLGVGICDPVSGERLVARDSTASPLTNDTYLVPLSP